MAKDYFQDITPPSDESHPSHRSVPPSDVDAEVIPIRVGEAPPLRGIRSISPPSRSRPRIGVDMREVPPVGAGLPPPPSRRFSRHWMWAVAGISLLVLSGLLLFVFRSTTVTVTPKSHTLVLNDTSQFTAYPEAIAVPGTLSYTVQTSDLEDSEVVPAQGTTHVENKASGSITVFNNYSTESVRLVKNTRFMTQGGLIFKAPADVVVPGKKGATPGAVDVTVVAAEAGEKYNVAPVAPFPLPGLKSSPDMYAHVYAKSSAAMTGGLVGDQPGTAPGALEAAKVLVRSRLEAKAQDAASTAAGATFASSAQITYQSQPNTIEAGGGVRIHEKAHIEIVVFPADQFAQTIARSVLTDADTAPVTLVPGNGFTEHIATTSFSALGSDPVQFTLSGTAQLVWKVDDSALAKALIGRDQGAFQTIVSGFPSIEEAHARIEPFWKRSFPSDPDDIKIRIVAPVEP